MKWKKEYEIGIEEVDNQHRKLVELINNYNKTISDKKINTSSEIGQVLIYLINYTDFHFKTEEKFMEKLNYPGINEHKEIHRGLIQKLKGILLKIKKKESYSPIEFYYFLMSWLNDHILGEDIKIRKYSSSNVTQEKINLKHIAQYYTEICDELTELESIKDSEDLEFRRIIYLDSIFDKFQYMEHNSYLNILKLLLSLQQREIITKEERDKLYYSLMLEKRLGKLKEIFTTNNFSDFDNILAILRK